MEYNCPNCGAPLTFSTKVSIYTTCTFCRSNVVRTDMDLKKIGEVGELLNDMSPFKVGTEGYFDSQHFRLLGRVKVGYAGGMWSEWYALFDDGKQGWLAEAQGHYMMSFLREDLQVPEYNSLEINGGFIFEDKEYIVDDRRRIHYLASEGELPFVYKPNYKGGSIDLRGPNGEFMNFLYGPAGKEAFLGRYQEFNLFRFQQLRTLHGWS